MGALEGVVDLIDAFGERDVVLASNAAFDAGGGGRVPTWTESGATFRRSFPAAGELVDAIRAAVPRCLTAEERRVFFLSAAVPRWLGDNPPPVPVDREVQEDPLAGAPDLGDPPAGLRTPRAWPSCRRDEAPLVEGDAHHNLSGRPRCRLML